MEVLYRISDGGNPKTKLAQAGKEACLRNAIATFGRDRVRVFADNCGEATLDMVRNLGTEMETCGLGNAMSWRHVAQYALDHFAPDQIVYLLEDDYLHLPGSAKALEEALAFAHYATLYDHPDKYQSHADGGPNPYIRDGAETTRVWCTATCHWKQTNSTTMTFATRVQTLREDRDIWWEFTSKGFPNDFGAFQRLQGMGSWENRIWGKHRILVSSLPGFSTHAETAWLSPLRDWTAFSV